MSPSIMPPAAVNRPLHVHFVTPKNAQSATSRYRCHHFAEALSPGVRVSVNAVTDARFSFDAPDVVVLHRLCFHGEANRVLTAARQVGAVCVASVDDLIFSPEYAFQVGLTSPVDDPAFYRYHRAEADDHLRTLQACDAVITSTEFLAGEAQLAVPGKSVYCLRNFLSAEMLTLADAAHGLRARRLATQPATKTFAYLSGSPTHDADFAEIAPVLASVMTERSETCLLLVGTVTLPSILEPLADAGRVRRHPFVVWRDLFALTAQADVTLAPLDASRLFNHAKSEIKALEAGAVGVPTVASLTQGAGEAGVGIPCRDAAEWHAALTHCVGSAHAEHAGALARDTVLSGGTVAAHQARVCETFRELAALAPRPASGTATVTRPARERLTEWLRGKEAAWFARGIRWERHVRLLKDELRKKG